VLRTSVSADFEIEIERPVADVWAFVSDLTRLPLCLDEFEEVVNESDRPLGKGSVLRYTVQPGPRSAKLELAEWEPGRRLAWDGPPFPGLAAEPGRAAGLRCRQSTSTEHAFSATTSQNSRGRSSSSVRISVTG
jgi:hypothetical protein